MALPNYEEIRNDALAKNAGSHNSIYRGKDITNLFYNGTLTTEIAAGTFDDIFVGDYIIGNVSGRKYLVADINYRLYTGDTECTTNHVLMIPEKIMGTAKINDTETSTGAYIGSKMYTTNLAAFRTIIQNDFGSGHVLQHRNYFKKGISNNIENSGGWYDSTVDLMNELMVCGSNIFHNVLNGTNLPSNTTVDKTQLSLFRMDKSKMVARDDNDVRQTWWLRDVVSSTNFSQITSEGRVATAYASGNLGVRPAFLIY